MKVLRLFRTLAFVLPDGEVQRGKEARGTLVLMDDEQRGLVMRFILDANAPDPVFRGGTGVELEIEEYEVLPCVPSNESVVVKTRGHGQYTFTAYRELPPADITQFTVVNLAVLGEGGLKVEKQ